MKPAPLLTAHDVAARLRIPVGAAPRYMLAMRGGSVLRVKASAFDEWCSRIVTGMVYFIGGADLVKIGWTAGDPARRLRKLSHESPVPLEMLAAEPGDRLQERYLHDRFAEHRDHGEWFRRGPEIDEYIAALLDAQAQEAA